MSFAELRDVPKEFIIEFRKPSSFPNSQISASQVLQKRVFELHFYEVI
jgi:hypothetical protein